MQCKGTISKFWEIVVGPFVCISVCVYIEGRYQNFHGFPLSAYCVYPTKYLLILEIVQISLNKFDSLLRKISFLVENHFEGPVAALSSQHSSLCRSVFRKR